MGKQLVNFLSCDCESNHFCQHLVQITYSKKYQCQVPLILGTRQTYLTCTCPKPGIHWPVVHVSPLSHINWHFIVFIDLYTVICLRGIQGSLHGVDIHCVEDLDVTSGWHILVSLLEGILFPESLIFSSSLLFNI
jgi:hypothetical protein